MYGIDWNADTYDLKYNRTDIGTDLAMQASVGTTNILKLSQGGTSTSHYAYIDVLVICTNCNPFVTLDTDSISIEVVDSIPGPNIKTWNVVNSLNIKTWNGFSWNLLKDLN